MSCVKCLHNGLSSNPSYLSPFLLWLISDLADKQVLCWAPTPVKFPFNPCCFSACAQCQQRAAHSGGSCDKATAFIGLITFIRTLGFCITSQEPQEFRRV